jgi:hypothetical protein
MTTSGWQDFAVTVRGRAREIFAIESKKKREEAIASYDVDRDRSSEVVRIQIRHEKDDEGRPITVKRETKISGLERTRFLLAAVKGDEAAEAELLGRAD